MVISHSYSVIAQYRLPVLFFNGESSLRRSGQGRLSKRSKSNLHYSRGITPKRVVQWFSNFLVEWNPNETFQRLEEP